MLKKSIAILLIFMMICTTVVVFADGDDNADTGSGGTNQAGKDKGFYRGSEYMYKVSVYVGLSDKADKKSSLNSEWHMIGESPLFIQPNHFALPSKIVYGYSNKASYLEGINFSPNPSPTVIVDDPPPIPITNGGNINSVKSYFGDVNTLNMLINHFAFQKGISREQLISNIQFRIDDVIGIYPPEEILPIKLDNKYQNKVPWLIVYEPVIISYLKDKKTVLAFTATEYALAQQLGYYDFKYGTDGQQIAKMTHSDLPNSIILQESWFGYPVTSALPDKTLWAESRIIQGGGWGMRMLKANAVNVVENDTVYDYEYRVNTDVITSVRVYANDDITPDNRHFSESAYKNPIQNTATISMTANGYSKSTEVVIPRGGSELVWIKWHTPLTPQEVDINVSISGNSAAYLDGGERNIVIKGKVVDLDLNIPPNPTANDRNETFIMPVVPVKAEKISANWGIYSCHWIPNWVWHPKWEWESNWVRKSYTYHHSGGCKSDGSCPGHRRYKWVDKGKWVDNGEWVDEGNWTYDYESYTASLSANLTIKPDDKVPTSNGKIMKSGYGFNALVTANPSSNAPSSHITYVQNAISYFPEFSYQNFWRVLDLTGNSRFEYKSNKYSTYNKRVHFTPVWFPDGTYKVYTEIIDFWTPDGMLRMNLTDELTINGSLYDDWHIGPKNGGD
jgi:hypothetical protein